MATLKEHQAAMVDLLANGSAIPASASRLAHAMHDVLKALDTELINYRNRIDIADGAISAFADRLDATTPGLNDKALAEDIKALQVDSPAKWPTPAEQRIKELENTIKQLKGNLAKVRTENDVLHRENERLENALVWHENKQMPEQAGCRKEDTQMCDHSYSTDRGWVPCDKCGKLK